MTNDSDINGTLLRHQRESMGWTLADMAARACLSPKQIKQLEEGGDTAFYSLSIKLNVAKKVAQILGVTEDELFSRIKSPKGSTLNESIEDIEAEQLALLASFESDPSPAQDDHTKTELPAVVPPLKDEPTKTVDLSKEVSAGETLKVDAPSKVETSSLAPDASHPVATEDKDTKQAQDSTPHDEEPLVSAAALKTPSQDVRPESMAPANFLSNADSHITQDTPTPAMSNGFKFLLFALLAFAAVVVLSPDVKNNLLEMGRQNGLLEPSSPQAAEQNPVAPPVDSTQSDTPVEPTLNQAGASSGATPLAAPTVAPQAAPQASKSPVPSPTQAPAMASSASPSNPVAPATTSAPAAPAPAANSSTP